MKRRFIYETNEKFEVLKERLFKDVNNYCIEENRNRITANLSGGIRFSILQLVNGKNKITISLRTEIKNTSRLLEVRDKMLQQLEGIELKEVVDIL